MDREFIDELVAMPSAALDELLRATELERRDAEHRMALIAAVVEQKSQFLVDGHRSMTAYLKAQINCSGATANRLRRRGRLFNEHPSAHAAVADGRISTDNADLLAGAATHRRVADRVADFVPALVDHAEHFPVRDFSVLVDRVVANADCDGAAPDDLLHADATVAAGPDGVYVNVIGGTGLQAAEMKAIFERACEVEFERDVESRRREFGDAASEHPLPRTASQRRFAAQYAIHMAWASTPPDAQRPEPVVSARLRTRRTSSHAARPGAPRRRRRRRRHDRSRQARRLFTGAARTAAQLIALACAHPGCSIPAELCDIDHLDRHADDGPTDQHNATPACGTHNRYKERAGLRSRRAANGRTYLIRPDGSVILPVGEHPPAWADPDPPEGSDPTSPTEMFETIGWDDYLARLHAVTTSDTTSDTDQRPRPWPILRLDRADPPGGAADGSSRPRHFGTGQLESSPR